MEIVNRIENKLLQRVEIDFQWKHSKQSTPSRQAVIEMVRGLEPGANPNLVVIKNCNTRFGMAMTTGRAYVYASEEAMSVEPAYIHKRHEALHGGASDADDREGGEAGWATSGRRPRSPSSSSEKMDLRSRANTALSLSAVQASSSPFTATASPAVAAVTPSRTTSDHASKALQAPLLSSTDTEVSVA